MAYTITYPDAGVKIKKLTRGANQPAVLTFQIFENPVAASISVAFNEIVKLDVAGSLEFTGRCVDIQRNLSTESVTYKAVDAYYDLNKEYAVLPTVNGDTNRIGFSNDIGQDITAPHDFVHADTIEEAITALLDANGIPYDATTLAGITGITEEIVTPFSKGGATWDDWLSDLLSLTAAGVCYIRPDYLLPSQYELTFAEFGVVGTEALQLSDWSTKADPDYTADPLIIGGSHTQRFSNRRAKTLIFEGAGLFQRVVGNLASLGRTFSAEIVYAADAPNTTRIRFHLPDSITPTSRYIDASTGEILDSLRLTVKIDDLGSPFTWSLTSGTAGGGSPSAIMRTNADYVEVDDKFTALRGWLSDDIDTFGIDTLSVDITEMYETMRYVVTDPSSLIDGEEVELHEQYFLYKTSTGTVLADFTAEFEAFAEQRAQGILAAAEINASIKVQMANSPTGLYPNFDIGVLISSPDPFTNLVLNAQSFDFERQEVSMSLSTLQLREGLSDLKAAARAKREQDTNNFVGIFQIDPDTETAFSGIRHIQGD